MSSTTSTGIREVSLVVVPCDDQDRQVEFYERLGFEKRTDVPMGDGYRWIEVYPPAGPTGIALAPPPPGKSAEPRETGIILRTEDIEVTHSELRSRDVETDEEISRMGDPVPPMFWFRDAEGNTLLVVQTD